ncbi:MAG: Disaggregatase related repeat-containing protein [Candidatus Kentron sp. G]|nr:MAG: Disaggregatase related repeat-containing protein [Candidatus Kentron sp. G]VFN07446.1 MAG: Disaggregatase related repeat-containing protein [Candidatus Kentron sp. G]
MGQLLCCYGGDQGAEDGLHPAVLVQFEELPTECSADDIRMAKMYLYFSYAHKASWHSVEESPNISRPLAVQRVLKKWEETEATSTQRMSGKSWRQEYLGLDNIDAEATPQGIPTYYHSHRPSGYMEFDVTPAVKNWAEGERNYGLLVWAMNEYEVGRDIRFYSREYSDTDKHPVLKVLCDY